MSAGGRSRGTAVTAEVLSLPRGGATGPAPLVPDGVDVRDAPDFRFNIARMLDSDWYHSCSKDEALAGINLHARAIHQVPAGSLPSADGLLARLADFGRDVDGWREVKAKALEGWVLCADGRWYHPDVARNALHIWVGRLEKRRASAFANQKQCPDRDFGMDEIEDDLLSAHAALRCIDPQDPVLRESTSRLVRWRASREKLALVVQDGERVEATDPSRGPSRGPSRDPLGGPPQDSSAQLSTDSHPDLRSGFSVETDTIDLEFEGGRGSVKRTPEWPPPAEAREQLRAIYPKWKDPGEVDKALAAVRKSGKVAFAAILAGAERVRDSVRDGAKDLQFVKHPARWLKARGWEDDPDPPDRDASGQEGRATRGRPSAIYGIRRRFEPRPQPGEGP